MTSSAEKTGPRLIAEDRGKLAILHPSGPVYNPCYFDIQPGKARFRGGHYHKSKTEVFYVISGSCLIRYYDPETGEHGSFGVQEGDMVTILPMCAHRMEAEEFCQVDGVLIGGRRITKPTPLCTASSKAAPLPALPCSKYLHGTKEDVQALGLGTEQDQQLFIARYCLE